MMHKDEPLMPGSLNLPAEEERLLARWEQEDTFAQSLLQRRNAKPFVFYEGPPTANGKPGIHHVLARSFKDAIPRYQTMRGRRVERKAGWDTHGLPVELEVEKKLGVSGKPEIENIVKGDVSASIARFNELCKESVWTYKDEWERLTQRMGFWVDLSDPYITYDRSYTESLWWVLKRIWEKELLYEDFKVVPYCPRCGTALSSHEVALGYDDVTDRSVVVKFAVKGRPSTYLLAWTTTPWTLPGNVALAVGPHVRYGVYHDRESGDSFILADDRVTEVFPGREMDRSEISLSELTSLEYEPLFALDALKSERSYKVYEAAFVTTEDGTGIVHTAVMYGEDDFRLGSSVGLPKYHTVDAEGKFVAGLPGLTGRFAKDSDTESTIIADLSERGLLVSEVPYTHTYPFCWRCKTPLLYYAKRSWFIRMSSLREQLLERNATVAWVPDHLGQGRFGEWLREVKDWALSRDRYWGTPLPIWHCSECSDTVCVESAVELAEISGSEIPEDLHRPYIDNVRWKCSACTVGTMERYPEVIDVWFDSGGMPLAQWGYPHNGGSREKLVEHYPADFIAEGLDQTRGWFYTLLAIATALGRPAPYRSVISHGLVLDAQGKKMSKSVGNVVNPWDAISEFGVDPIRLFFYSVNQPGENKRFDSEEIQQLVRKVFLILWNVQRFLAERGGATARIGQQHVLDRWAAARLEEVAERVTDAMERLDLFRASRELIDWTTELSTWYLRLSRKREDKDFLPSLAWALRQTALLFAPLTPFFAELLWERVRTDTDPTSVHLADWPVAGPYPSEILTQMQAVQRLVELGRAARVEAKIKVRQPLAKATVSGIILSDDLAQLLADELNVKVIAHDNAQEHTIVLDTVLTDSLKQEGVVREVIRSVQQLRKALGLSIDEPARLALSGQGAETLMESHAEIEAATRTTVVEGLAGGVEAEVNGITLRLER